MHARTHTHTHTHTHAHTHTHTQTHTSPTTLHVIMYRRLLTAESPLLKMNTAGRNGLAIILTGHAIQTQVSQRVCKCRAK